MVHDDVETASLAGQLDATRCVAEFVDGCLVLRGEVLVLRAVAICVLSVAAEEPGGDAAINLTVLDNDVAVFARQLHLRRRDDLPPQLGTEPER
jgi:hypothetical protein